MCIFSFIPLSLSVFCITLYALVISVPYFDFVVSTMMAFESCSYATIMYLYPLADVTGNRPVWSVYIFDDNSITNKNTWCNRVRGISSSDKKNCRYFCPLLIIFITWNKVSTGLWVIAWCFTWVLFRVFTRIL